MEREREGGGNLDRRGRGEKKNRGHEAAGRFVHRLGNFPVDMIIELVHVLVRMLNLRLGRDGLQEGNIAMGKARVKLTNSKDKTRHQIQ